MHILKATVSGYVKPTHIMYESNTSWTILQKNLDALLSLGFVNRIGEGRAEYAITEKGKAVLRAYFDLVGRTAELAKEVGK